MAGASLLHRRTSGTAQPAGRLEEAAARAWNVLNEGKPFTLVFTLGVLLVAPPSPAGIGAALPLALAWWRHAYPLHLRLILWLLAAGIVVLAGGLAPSLALLGLFLYLSFTVILWGGLYYHLRLGAPLSNVTRFWRLVLENPDTTSGNLLEQLPKVAALLAVATSRRPLPVLWALGAGALLVGEVMHRRLITWVPGRATGERPEDRRPRRAGPACCGEPSRKVLLVVIDGCRSDRLAEAHTPFLDQLASEGVSYRSCETVYPARTVTCFASMLTGAPPAVHGLRSNFVPSLGTKCESIFDLAPAARLVGIAHLVDAFGQRVRTVTAVLPNDEIDAALCTRALAVVDQEDPDLLVVQTLSVDQTGHVRGSYSDEYVARIEATDRELRRLVGALAERWGGLDRVTIGVLADHGQGRGIGGHGHWTPPERLVPCIWWGAGVPPAPVRAEVSILDVAPTLSHRLGVPAPSRSVGACLLCDPDDRAADPPADPDRHPDHACGPEHYGASSARPPAEPASAHLAPIVVVLPVHDEAPTVGQVLARVPSRVAGRPVERVVVDDGSSDGSAEVAAAAGALVLRHGRQRGLGAAVRTGLRHALDREAWAAAFLDADGEYDPLELPQLLKPIADGEADYVVGSRFTGTIESMRPERRLGNRVLTVLTAALAGRRLTDAQSGFRAVGADALPYARIDHDYNYAQVLTLALLRQGFRYAEVPVRYCRRRSGRSFVTPGRYLRHVLPAMLRASRTR